MEKNYCQVLEVSLFAIAIVRLFPEFSKMENVQQIVLWKRLSAQSEGAKWMSQTFPKLKYLSYHVDEELKVNDELKAFFQRHAAIEKFSLLSSNIQTVSQCVENGIEIHELLIKLTHNMKENFTILKDFCGNNLTKRLHLFFYRNNMRDKDDLELLMSLKPNVDGLYFNEDSYFADEFMDVIKTFHQLRVIQLTPNHHSFVLSLVDALPLLEQVYIYDNLYADEIGVDVDWFSKQAQIVSSLISRSRKLRKIFVWRHHKNLLFEDYDKQRKLLDGAEKLTVFINVITPFKFLFEDLWKVETIDVILTENKHIRNPLVKNFLKRSF